MPVQYIPRSGRYFEAPAEQVCKQLKSDNDDDIDNNNNVSDGR